jgi:hypothetical protein
MMEKTILVFFTIFLMLSFTISAISKPLGESFYVNTSTSSTTINDEGNCHGAPDNNDAYVHGQFSDNNDWWKFDFADVVDTISQAYHSANIYITHWQSGYQNDDLYLEYTINGTNWIEFYAFSGTHEPPSSRTTWGPFAANAIDSWSKINGFQVRLRGSSHGSADTYYYYVDAIELRVSYNHPPELTCPDSGSVLAGHKFTSNNFSVNDPDEDTALVSFLGIIPFATHNPTIVGSHVEWNTTCTEIGNYTISLVATDPKGLKDTCEFTVTVYNRPPVLTCPGNGSVHSGNKFTSGNFSITDPDGDAAQVNFLSINPSVTHNPTIVSNHVEWSTTCAENGNYTISLVAADPCSLKDTCQFTVNVYNQPPVLACPGNGNVRAGNKFISSNYSFTDPESDPTTVSFLDITPPATNTPTLVSSHVEWLTTCNESGIYTIRLIATDNCSAKDTCSFQITVTNTPPEITCPDSMAIHTGHYSSGNFSTGGSIGDTIVQVRSWVNPSGSGITNLAVFGGTGVISTSGHVEFDANCNYPGLYVISLEATDKCGLKDTCTFQVRLYERPPLLTCPNNGSVHSGYKFTSTDFSVSDLDGDAVSVTILSIIPPPTNNPSKVGNHVEWSTTCAEKGDYTIRLLATDPCGLKDTCDFTVNVYNQPPVLTCPNNDSIHAEQKYISANYSYTEPESDPVTVSLCGITPVPTNQPAMIGTHVEWQTGCADAGKNFTICLLAADNCGAKDTCYLQVKVYNRPPQLTCPNYKEEHAGQKLISSDFSVTDSDGDIAPVTFFGITPTPNVANNPMVVGNHVEWQTAREDTGLFTIKLLATDPCGGKDTCDFTVRSYNNKPEAHCQIDSTSYTDRIELSAAGISTDPDYDDITHYAWKQVSGPPVTIINAGLPDSNYIQFARPTTEGTYRFRTWAYDGKLWSDSTEECTFNKGESIVTLKINLENIIFPATSVGDSSDTFFTIENTGNATATIYSIKTSKKVYHVPWSGSVSILPLESKTCHVHFVPTSESTYVDTIRISSNAEGDYIVSLSGKGIAPKIEVTPSPTIAFGEVAVGSNKSIKITIRNTGSDVLKVTSIIPSPKPPFDISGKTKMDIKPDSSDFANVIFTPTQSGDTTGTLTISSNAGNIIRNLTGKGVKVDWTISPDLVVFDSTRVGVWSSPETITVYNNGSNTLNIDTVKSDSKIQLSKTSLTINAGSNGSLTAKFKPIHPSVDSGNITFIPNGFPSKIVTYQGVGLQESLVVSPTYYNFGDVDTGSVSDLKTFTITNDGSDTTTIQSIQAIGTSQFSIIQGNCIGNQMNANETCTFKAKFTPHQHGLDSTWVTMKHSAKATPDTCIKLSGYGTVPILDLTRNSIDFGTQVMGTRSDSIVGVTNTGDGTIRDLWFELVNPSNFQLIDTEHVQADSIRNSEVVNFKVRFYPSTGEYAGQKDGLVTVHSNAGYKTVSLKGVAQRPDIVIRCPGLGDRYDFGGVSVKSDLTVECFVMNYSLKSYVVDTIMHNNDSFFKLDSIGKKRDTDTLYEYDPQNEERSKCYFNYTFHPDITLKRDSIVYDTVIVYNPSDSVLTSSIFDGKGIAPLIQIPNPDSLKFRFQLTHIDQSSKDTFDVVIRNIGSDTLEITDVFISPDKYRVIRIFPMMGLPSFPDKIKGKGERSFKVAFHPTEVVSYKDTLYIISNALNNSTDGAVSLDTVRVFLFGEGFYKDNLRPDIDTISPAFPMVNNSALIKAKVVDPLYKTYNSGVARVFLHYRRGNADYSAGFDSIEMEPNGIDPGTYQNSIPKSSVTLAGSEYKISATDNAGNDTSTDVFPVQVRFPSGSQTQPSSFWYGSNKIKEQWILLSIPGNLDDPSLGPVFTDALNVQPGEKTWKLIGYEGGWKEYKESSDTPFDSPGKGFWFKRVDNDNGFNVKLGSGLTVPTDKPFPLVLKAGWNLVGNPFLVDSLLFKPIPLIDGPYSYGTNWIEPNTDSGEYMLRWKGYAVKSAKACTLYLDLHSKTVYTSDSKGMAPPLPIEYLWRINLFAKAGDLVDKAYLGCSESCSKDKDRVDLAKPPSIEPAVSIYFPKREWENLSDDYATDYRGIINDGASWKFTIDNYIDHKEMDLGWEGINSVPAEFEALLYDRWENVTVNMREKQTYHFTHYQNHDVNRFEVLVGLSGYVEREISSAQAAIPREFRLGQNYPNPFNPRTSIDFEIPRGGEVEIKVYNILGQSVVTLYDELTYPGKYIVTWDGKDKEGKEVSSGIYFYRLFAPAYSKSLKMILLK